MSPRPPSDGVVAVRSLPRRFRGLFAGLGEDESPDALARRPAADGWSALGHLVAATRALAAGGRALEQVLTADDAVVDPIEVDTPPAPEGTLDDRLSELGWEADALADRADRASAEEWGRRAQLRGGAEASALDLLWTGIDAAVGHLRSAERVLVEVRQAR